MTSLSSLAPSPNSPATLPSDAAAPAAGAGRGGRVRAVEYLPPVGDSLQDRARQSGPRPSGARPSGARQPQAQRGLLPRPEDEHGHRLRGARRGGEPAAADGGTEAAASALFLVQVFGQDQAPPQVALAAHRDAAVLASEAYRRAGATPPVYSEQPTLFRIAV